MSFIITKASGQQEEFSFHKLERSLRKAGASQRLINQIIDEVQHIKPQTTQQVHEYAIQRLAQENPPIAARYNLKRALMELGPAGYSFEQFVGQLLLAQQFEALVGQEIYGACIHHEVDIVATKASRKYMIECKFHNSPGIKTDIKVPLYIRARFEDIEKQWKKENPHTNTIYQAWIFSNTQFTIDAIQYANCVGMRLTGWGYPIGESLAEMIDAQKLHPITALTSLSHHQKRQLIAQGLILCKDIEAYHNELKQMGLNPDAINKITQQALMLCELPREAE